MYYAAAEARAFFQRLVMQLLDDFNSNLVAIRETVDFGMNGTRNSQVLHDREHKAIFRFIAAFLKDRETRKAVALSWPELFSVGPQLLHNWFK